MNKSSFFLPMILLSIMPLSSQGVGSNKVAEFDLEKRTVLLNSGYEMPLYGIGTWAISDKEAEESVYYALKAGARLIDTAHCYGNESGVGRGVKKSGVKRSEIFITTKLWYSDYDDVPRAVDAMLKRLGTDYIDLLLLHYPASNDVEAYKGMEKCVKSGKVRSIGVSNFEEEDFMRILNNCSIIPAVLQNETHPYNQSKEMKIFIKKYGTVFESWYPLGGRGHTQVLFNDPTIKKIASAHKRTSAQVILRWHIQSGNVIMPGSTNPAHIKENTELFDFALTEEEMREMEKLDKHIWWGGH